MKFESKMAFGEPNLNGYIWTVDVMKKAIEDYKKKIVNNKEVLCFYNEIEENSKLNIQNDNIFQDAAAKIKDINLTEDNKYEIDCEILDTAKGKLLKSLLDCEIEIRPNMRIIVK